MDRFQQNLKNSMRSTGFSIHRSLTNKPIFLPPLHKLKTVHIMRDGILGQPFHKNSIKFGLVKVECFGLGEILEEVVDFLVVYLQVHKK